MTISPRTFSILQVFIPLGCIGGAIITSLLFAHHTLRYPMPWAARTTICLLFFALTIFMAVYIDIMLFKALAKTPVDWPHDKNDTPGP